MSRSHSMAEGLHPISMRCIRYSMVGRPVSDSRIRSFFAMAKKERIRESLTGLPTIEYLMQRIEMGWRPSAIEWERDIVPAGVEQPYAEEIPYGLQVALDCAGLVENPTEKEVVTMALDLIVEDCALSRVASELNLRGYKTRAGKPWTPSDLRSEEHTSE